jgi:succinate-semialdehyde dehydrogenase/glutarate-semialdehyde dehydrogenase
MFTVVNPATGQVAGTFPAHSAVDTRRRVKAAAQAFESWRRASFGERAAVLQAAANILRNDSIELAILMATEMGKPVTQGRAEVLKCAMVCEHYAANGEAMLADEPVRIDRGEATVCYRPLGTVLAVMPWNFPLWQVFRASAPALMAGNVMLLKHASNVPGCALAIERIWRQAGAPEGVFTTLLIDGKSVKSVIRAPSVKAVTLTGSTAAGRAVAREAGSRLKKSVLELGGSDPYLILEDADLELAVETCARSRLINSGQSCIAAKRFIVVESLRREFEGRFAARLAAAKVGDPLDESTEVGPLARADLRDEVHDQVQRSVERGAVAVVGGDLPGRPGAWYPVTMLTGVKRGTAAWSEEVFGPVAAVIGVRNEREAIKVANATTFGLGAAVFTRDVERGLRIAREELAAGTAVVNTLVQSDPRLPFGGIGESGYGRELGVHGIREFVNVKTVVMG